MQANLTEISRLAEQIVSALGMVLVEVKMAQQGKNRSLEVTIYKHDARVSLDDCEEVSRRLGSVLEEQNPPLIDGSYVLEVQSPGIDRKLSSEREFAIFQGLPVEVKTKQKVDGLGSAFTGSLAGFADGRVVIEHPEKMSDRPKAKKPKAAEAAEAPGSIEVDMTNVIHVRLIPQMPPPSKA